MSDIKIKSGKKKRKNSIKNHLKNYRSNDVLSRFQGRIAADTSLCVRNFLMASGHFSWTSSGRCWEVTLQGGYLVPLPNY